MCGYYPHTDCIDYHCHRDDEKERKGKGTKDSGSFFLTSQDTSTAAVATQQVAIHSGPFKLATLTIPSNDLTLSLFFHFPSLFILQLQFTTLTHIRHMSQLLLPQQVKVHT